MHISYSILQVQLSYSLRIILSRSSPRDSHATVDFLSLQSSWSPAPRPLLSAWQTPPQRHCSWQDRDLQLCWPQVSSSLPMSATKLGPSASFGVFCFDLFCVVCCLMLLGFVGFNKLKSLLADMKYSATRAILSLGNSLGTALALQAFPTTLGTWETSDEDPDSLPGPAVQVPEASGLRQN